MAEEVTTILKLVFLTCTLCGWEYLKTARALVPALHVISECGSIPLEEINPEDHVCCPRCAGKVQKNCPEAEFFPLWATRGLIAKLLAKKAEYLAREAKREAAFAAREAAIQAEAEKFRRVSQMASHGIAACVSRRPVLSAVKIKTVDKNGRPLKGAVAHNQVRKALEPFAEDQLAKKTARAARREAKKAARAEKLARARGLRAVS